MVVIIILRVRCEEEEVSIYFFDVVMTLAGICICNLFKRKLLPPSSYVSFAVFFHHFYYGSLFSKFDNI